MILFLIICTDSESVDCLLQNKEDCGCFRTKKNEKEEKSSVDFACHLQRSAVRSLDRQSVTAAHKRAHRTTIVALRFSLQSK